LEDPAEGSEPTGPPVRLGAVLVDPVDLVEGRLVEAGSDTAALAKLGRDLDRLARLTDQRLMAQLLVEDDPDERRELYDYHVFERERLVEAHKRLILRLDTIRILRGLPPAR
jgi:hypothetical protein